MSTPTTGLAKSDLDALAGWHLGYGRDSTAWSTEQTAIINEMVKMAQRRVYITEEDPNYGVPGAYKWTFLKPVLSVTLESGQQYRDLPDDFGGLEGAVTISLSGSSGFAPIPQMSEPYLRTLYANSPSATGKPQAVAVEWLPGQEQDRGQRARLVIYPIPDAAYILKFQYYLTPDAMSGTRPYPYGGAQHAELFKAAVLACCDLEVHGQLAERHDYFMRRLRAAIVADQRNREQQLGYVGDRIGPRPTHRERHWDGGVVTFNSVEY